LQIYKRTSVLDYLIKEVICACVIISHYAKIILIPYRFVIVSATTACSLLQDSYVILLVLAESSNRKEEDG
jgi:hypothetical protein